MAGKFKSDGLNLVMTIMLTILVGAAVLPSALDDWFNASTGSWGTGVASLWPIVPLVAIIGLVYYYIQQAG